MTHETIIESLDFQGRGVAHLDGKAVFVSGALPDERVRFHIYKEKKRFAEAQVTSVLDAAPIRVAPRCIHYDLCGGCELQHAAPQWQLEAKQQLWLEQLQRLGGVTPKQLLPPLFGASWHYRRRARLSVSYVGKEVLLGFKARQSHKVVNVSHCMVLDARMSDCFASLRLLLKALLPMRVEELSIHAGDDTIAVGLKAKHWAQEAQYKIEHWLSTQAKQWQVWRHGAGLIAPQAAPSLTFSPTESIALPFTVDDFTQVNAAMNQAMVAQALHLLDVQKGMSIVDLFCGLGNFAIPLAQAGANVLAIEGVHAMVERLRETAATLMLTEQIDAQRADLFSVRAKDISLWGSRDAWLLDPPRAGAQALVSALPKKQQPTKILYVSCNPATLARDAKILVEKGYSATQGGIVNMFPQTAHIESMLLFER